ncbi:MAG: Crp/Fnr family transcriptional regulator [Bacteroidota bacterium]|nr:Crp/Fnr family transcriptional regulator [Bacteroidota bacterium]
MSKTFFNSKIDCTKCGYRSNSFFNCLTKSNLEALNQNKIPHLYQRGQVIFYEGNPAFAMYCIHSGRVKLYKHRKNGESQAIRLLGALDVMGYRALFANEPYSVTAEAVEPTTICTISKEEIFAILKKSPELTLKFLSKLSKELRISEEQILTITDESVTERTVRLLFSLLQVSSDKSKSQTVIKCPLSRGEMAQMVGTSPETLSRTLHSLERKGIITVKGHEINILNIAGLKELMKD